jgi:hypothetical protein
MSKETKCTCERPDDNTCEYCEQQSSIQILEQAVNNLKGKELFKESNDRARKLLSERMYSEEEVYELLLKHQSAYRSVVRNTSPLDWSFDIKQWFEQFKKK